MVKLYDILIKERLCDVPFSNKKCVDPLSLLAIGSSLVSGFTGSMAQEDANRTNRQIARENREWQSEENQKNRDYATLMFDKENEYKSPANQRKLLEQAGYNPYLFGNDYSASGASASTPTMSSAPDSARVNAVNPLQGVNEGLQGFARFMQIGNESLQVESNVDLQRMKSLESLADVMIKVYNNMGQKGLDQFNETYAPYIKSLNFSGSPAERRLNAELLTMESQAAYNDLKTQIYERFGAQKAEREMEILQHQPDLMLAEIEKYKSGAMLDYASAHRVGSEIARNLAESGFFNAQAVQINTLLPYLSTQFQLTLGSLGMDYLTKKADFDLNEYVREWQSSDKAKAARKRTRGMQSDVNIVGAFMDGFVSKIPNGLLQGGFNTKSVRSSSVSGSIEDITPELIMNRIGF